MTLLLTLCQKIFRVSAIYFPEVVEKFPIGKEERTLYLSSLAKIADRYAAVSDRNNFSRKETRNGMKRTGLIVMIVLSLILSSGVALAVTKRGTSGPNTLYGTSDWDYLYGYGGSDILYGRGEWDELYGGDGIDYLYGEGGDDELRGDAQSDYLYGGAGWDTVKGGYGHDIMYGGDGDDWLYGGYGDDTMSSNAGDDILEGQPGADKLYGGNGEDDQTGGAGADRYYGGYDDDVIWSEDGVRDVIDCGPGVDLVFADGADSILGNCEDVYR